MGGGRRQWLQMTGALIDKKNNSVFVKFKQSLHLKQHPQANDAVNNWPQSCQVVNAVVGHCFYTLVQRTSEELFTHFEVIKCNICSHIFYKARVTYMHIIMYCKSGNFRENLIFANIREFVASRK